MNIISFIIAAMFLFQVSMYAQNTGQVTLSIRLYPIQIIEIEPINTLSFQVSYDNLLDSSLSSQLSTFSTSHYCLKVDTIINNVMQVSNQKNGVPPRHISSSNLLNEESEENYCDNNYHIVYSMETL